MFPLQLPQISNRMILLAPCLPLFFTPVLIVYCQFLQIAEDDRKEGLSSADPIGRALIEKHRLDLVECADANGNTPLSEAAAGGQSECIRTLLRLGAEVNRRGQFGRTPLYRAAFGAHLYACRVCVTKFPSIVVFISLSRSVHFSVGFDVVSIFPSKGRQKRPLLLFHQFCHIGIFAMRESSSFQCIYFPS